jgi:predicted HicB family RNase H-like nuclease
MFDPSRYSILVRHVEIDGEATWRGTVKELPDVAVFAEDAHAAYDAAVDVIRDLYKAAQEDNRPFPDPETEMEEYSGRITLRMPPSLHQRVAELAEVEDTSLNQYIVMIVTSAVSATSPSDIWSGGVHPTPKENPYARIEGSVTLAQTGRVARHRGSYGMATVVRSASGEDIDVIWSLEAPTVSIGNADLVPMSNKTESGKRLFISGTVQTGAVLAGAPLVLRDYDPASANSARAVPTGRPRRRVNG